MAVTSTPKTTLDAVTRLIQNKQPELSVLAGDGLCWSPKNHSITYRADDESDENIWGLLHEAGHALLQHSSYDSDVKLLLMEVAAWDAAVELAGETNIIIDAEHIQDCLDTYRDWLHQRSTCPRCGIVTFQENSRQYRCFNCQKAWTVSSSRLCRPYRLSAINHEKLTKNNSETIFQ